VTSASGKTPIPVENPKTAKRDAKGPRNPPALSRLEPTGASRFALDSPALIGVGLVALTLAVYAQVWDFEFIRFDDHVYTDSNVHVAAGLTPAAVSWAFRAFYQANWIPLTWISLMVDASLYGNWPGGYHITNVLLHAANVLLLFYFLSGATGQKWPSATVAALFAVHPIHAESVAWVTERKDVLSIFFGLVSLSFYSRYARHRTYTSLLPSLLGMIASLLSKQTLVTLPFVFLLIDYWPLGRFGKERTRSLLLEKLPFFVLIPVSGAITLVAQTSGNMNEIAPAPLALRVANALLGYVSYLGKALLPLRLGVFYPFETNVDLVSVGAAAAVLLGVSVVALRLWRRFPFLAVGWLWFLGTLVPMIGVVKVGRQQMADRYAYFPFIGLYVAVVWLAMSLIASHRLRVALAVVALAFYAALGFVQVSYWRDGLILAEHTSAVTKPNWFCHSLLGNELLGAGRTNEAIETLREGVRIAPHEPEIDTDLGNMLIGAGRLREAAHAYRCALANREDSIDARSGLAWTYLHEKKYADAKREFERALEVDPTLPNLLFSMAYACRLSGDYEESNRYCKSCLAQDPDRTACLRMMADNLDSLGRPAEAAEIRKSLPAPRAAPGAPPGSGAPLMPVGPHAGH
jgi:tetratricopeptide (TPR) repeat protein